MNRMLPGTRALRTFEAAGRHLNFTHAANELGLTPAAVSYQIKEIEEQLGVVLFTRTSRSIGLTPAGSVLLEATVDALNTLTRATNRARSMARGSEHVRLSLGARFATNWLLPRLPRLRAAHPDLALTFDITDQVRDFDTDDIDAAIRFGTGHYPSTEAVRLFNTVVVPICSPQLIASGIKLDTPHDLRNQLLCYVDCQVDGMVWPNWAMWMAAAGIDNFDDSHCLAFSDSSHVVQAVADGTAIGLVELDLIHSDLAQGRVVRLFDIGVHVAPEYAYHFVYPDKSKHDPRIEKFNAWLQKEIQREQSAVNALNTY